MAPGHVDEVTDKILDPKIRTTSTFFLNAI